jgi:hypothetical protein
MKEQPTYEEGYSKGEEAFALGLPRAPALDASTTIFVFASAAAGRNIGDVDPFMKGWLDGWDFANLTKNEEVES